MCVRLGPETRPSYGTVATVATVSSTRGDASPQEWLQGPAAPEAPRPPRRHGASSLPRGPRARAGGHLAPEERRFATAFGVHAPVMPVLIRLLFLCARPPGGEPQRAALPDALRAWAGRRRRALARRQRCSVATLRPRAAGASHAPRGSFAPRGSGKRLAGGWVWGETCGGSGRLSLSRRGGADRRTAPAPPRARLQATPTRPAGGMSAAHARVTHTAAGAPRREHGPPPRLASGTPRAGHGA